MKWSIANKIIQIVYAKSVSMSIIWTILTGLLLSLSLMVTAIPQASRVDFPCTLQLTTFTCQTLCLILIHFCSFKFKGIAIFSIFTLKSFILYQNVCIYIIFILFALNLRRPTMLYEDDKVIICKVMCISLVKQDVTFVD